MGIVYHTKNIRPATDKRFMIFGERNSGTNFLSKLIYKNFGLVDSNLIIWKHWMGFTNGGKPIQPGLEHTLAIGIIRDPINWLSSMKAGAPHARHISRLPWPKFLQAQWWSCHDDMSYGYEIMEDRDFDTGQRYDNILKLRSKKLGWLLDPNIPCPYILVRYGDLINNMSAVLDVIKNTFEIKQLHQDYVSVSRDVKHGGNFARKTRPKPPPDCIDFIRNNLDLKLEEKVGYKI